MTSTIALIGKSGSGKTTITKALAKLIKKNFSDSTILMIDNDLTLELSESFGIKTKNTIYGIKSGKHEYKTGIPEGMTKQEYCYQKCMNREIVVQGNPRVYKALYTELKTILSELQRIEAGGSVNPDLLEVIDQINVTIYGMSKTEN